jgi:ADP-heptose:LPS heptosyltransferase
MRDFSAVHSLLVVELTRLGDVLAMLPVMRLLAQQFPDARISLLVDGQYASFLNALDLPCAVYGVERPETVRGFMRAVSLARKLNADLALSMSPPKRNAAVTLASGAARKVGYLTYVDSLTPYLKSTPIEAIGCSLQYYESYGMENIEERSLKVCRALGVQTDGARRGIAVNATVWNRERDALLGERKLPRRPFIVLHPFSGWTFRSWPLERFMEVAETIRARLPEYEVVFLCEKSEAPQLAPVQHRYEESRAVHVIVSDDLVRTSIVLKEAALFVGNDSGPLHLAAALGTRVVGLFGPATPALTAPRSAQGRFLYERVECSPCDQCVCVRPERSCMTLISTADVVRSLLALLPVQTAVEAVANA